MFALLALLSAPTASADPVRIVTSGQIYQLVEDGETGASFSGSGFVISNGEVLRRAQVCFPCVTGASLDLSGTLTFRSFPPGSAIVDGVTYESVFFGGSFDIDAGSVTVPALAVGGDEYLPARFTMSGTLAGFADESRAGAPLFTLRLTGGGVASMGFFRYETQPDLIIADGFQYNFDQLAATPEPGSLLLFATGAGWMARRWRRRE